MIPICFFIISEVFKARDKKTKKLVAMKKVLMENEKEGVILIILSDFILSSVIISYLYRIITHLVLDILAYWF